MKMKTHKVKNKILKTTPFLQEQFPTYDRFLIINLEHVHFYRNRVLFERAVGRYARCPWALIMILAAKDTLSTSCAWLRAVM